jgi:formate dehydrogenase major subunit
VTCGTETTSICCFCGGGCGLIVTSATVDGAPKVVNVEGDPDHPFNEGALCSKGAAIGQIANRPGFDLAKEPGGNAGTRLVRPLRRSPGATAWTEIPWSQAVQEIAQAVGRIRDHSSGPDDGSTINGTTVRSFVTTDSGGRTVNRCESIYSLGGAALDNEEAYLLSKMMRALGVVYLEHQARI